MNKAGDSRWIPSISVSRCSSLRSPAGCSKAWIVSKKEDDMAGPYLFGGILAFGLLVYLMIALLKAEWF